MSRAATLSNYEIRAEGWKALTERLGVSGAIRFLMEYDPGRGDYVEERRELFRDLTLDEAIARAREKSGGRSVAWNAVAYVGSLFSAPNFSGLLTPPRHRTRRRAAGEVGPTRPCNVFTHVVVLSDRITRERPAAVDPTGRRG